MEFEILSVYAREVLDSRGNPTVEVEVKTKSGISRAIVPSGASTGIHEALELRDCGSRFLGGGVQKAVSNVKGVISKNIVGMDCRKQQSIDDAMIELDGTGNKSGLGANAILGASMAVTRAAALELEIPLYRHIENLANLTGKDKQKTKPKLPIPSMNIINGGVHGGNKLDVQEYMVLPVGAKNFRESIRICAEVYQNLKNILKRKYGMNAINVGDEGGFAPPLEKLDEPIELIRKAAEKAGYTKEVKIGMDVAASEFYLGDGLYKMEGKKLNGTGLMDKYRELIDAYPLISLEDGFAQDDWEDWTTFTREFGNKIQIIGDDLLVTNVKRIKKAIETKACNALLLKVNQIGTISESISANKLAAGNKWNVMVSHRSGETEDPYIADLVVGLGTGQIKSGAPCR